MRNLMLLAVLALFFASPAPAAETGDIKALTKEKIDFVVEVLRDKSIPKEERNRRIIATVEPMFDFAKMAKLSLGKKHWTPLSKAQRKEFIRVFSKRLQESYLEKLDLYTDEQVVVEDAKKVKKRIHVVTFLVSQDDRKEMVYKFYKSKRGWKVYDVVILGVSVVQTYRSQFNGVLKKESFETLMVKLKTSGEFAIEAAMKK